MFRHQLVRCYNKLTYSAWIALTSRGLETTDQGRTTVPGRPDPLLLQPLLILPPIRTSSNTPRRAKCRRDKALSLGADGSRPRWI